VLPQEQHPDLGRLMKVKLNVMFPSLNGKVIGSLPSELHIKDVPSHPREFLCC